MRMNIKWNLKSPDVSPLNQIFGCYVNINESAIPRLRVRPATTTTQNNLHLFPYCRDRNADYLLWINRWGNGVKDAPRPDFPPYF
jgi:hypothetical protein